MAREVGHDYKLLLLHNLVIKGIQNISDPIHTECRVQAASICRSMVVHPDATCACKHPTHTKQASLG